MKHSQNNSRLLNTNSFKLYVLALSLSLAACGKDLIPESKKFHAAPRNNSETGSIVSGLSESDMADLLAKNNNLTVRVVNASHQLYEVRGAEPQELRNLIQNPDVIIEKNKYIDLKLVKANSIPPEPPSVNPIVNAIENYTHLKLGGDIVDFVSTCKLDSAKAPKIQLAHNQGMDRMKAGILLDFGKTLVIDASQSKATGPKKDPKLQYLWIVTTPEYSMQKPMATLGNSITYTPDETGPYSFSLVAKDSDNYCDLDLDGFYVTENTPYSNKNALPDSDSSRIDVEKFWHVIFVGATQMWNRAKGDDMIVGIIDSGVDYNHPALAANILINDKEIPDNGIDDDKNGFIDDYAGYDFGQDDGYPVDDYGHGTHVAGIAASNVFGAARKAKILALKFGAGMGFDIASVTGAIKYSVDRGAKVLNMSFGWDEDLAVVRDALKYAEDHDVLIAAAAGNETTNNDTHPSYPCSYPNKNIISVAATDENNNLTFYSNFGHNVHIGAPGGTPEKPIISSYKKNAQNAQYVGLMGTSMASPLVAGVAAQVWSANPNLTAVEVKQILLDTGKSVPALAGKILTGKVIDAKAAVEKALNTRLESSVAL